MNWYFGLCCFLVFLGNMITETTGSDTTPDPSNLPECTCKEDLAQLIANITTILNSMGGVSEHVATILAQLNATLEAPGPLNKEQVNELLAQLNGTIVSETQSEDGSTTSKVQLIIHQINETTSIIFQNTTTVTQYEDDSSSAVNEAVSSCQNASQAAQTAVAQASTWASEHELNSSMISQLAQTSLSSQLLQACSASLSLSSKLASSHSQNGSLMEQCQCQNGADNLHQSASSLQAAAQQALANLSAASGSSLAEATAAIQMALENLGPELLGTNVACLSLAANLSMASLSESLKGHSTANLNLANLNAYLLSASSASMSLSAEWAFGLHASGNREFDLLLANLNAKILDANSLSLSLAAGMALKQEQSQCSSASVALAMDHLCPENEIFSFCATDKYCDELQCGCEEDDEDEDETCYAACQCKHDHARSNNGRCVHVSQCKAVLAAERAMENAQHNDTSSH